MKIAARLTCLLVFVVFSLSIDLADARDPDPKKLQIFILAGQSNMVGHANYITIPRLFADERPEVQKLGKLVFKKDVTVTREMVDEQIAVRIARDKIKTELSHNRLFFVERQKSVIR